MGQVKAEMITKAQIAELKQNDLAGLHRLIQEKSDSRELLFILENLGYLPRGFDAKILLPFLQHPNDQVRLWAVKNLGKVSLDFLTQVFCLVHRITKEGRFLIVNTSLVIVPRTVRAHCGSVRWTAVS